MNQYAQVEEEVLDSFQDACCLLRNDEISLKCAFLWDDLD